MDASPLKPNPRKTIGCFVKKSTGVLYAALIEPHAADEDSRRPEYILNVILTGSIALLLLLDASIIYHVIGMGSRYRGISPVAFSCIPLFFACLHVLSRRGRFTLASYLLIATYFASDSYAVYRWGVYLPTALLGYAMTIIIAGILIDTKFGFFLTALTTIFITPLWYLQANGLLSFQPQNINGSDGVVFGALYAVIMIITWLSNRETGRSLARARKSEQELQHERDSLEIRVGNRTRELRKAQFEKMEQVNQFAKFGQLASGLFHDMLNIMNTLSLTIDLRSGDENPASTESRLAAGNASATTKQIEQFMVAIRKQLNRQECDERFSIMESIEQVIQLLSYKAHREGVRIAFEHGKIPDIIHFGNPFKFHQIMFNLILNAIESHEMTSRESGRERAVTVSVEKREPTVVIHVSDRGCGIEQTVGEKIFEPFFSTKIEPKGMGIGLASVKKIVEEDFGGTIAITDNDGGGSIFTVTLPARQA